MSQIDDEAMRQRSVKLCQLIYDRKIENEISHEIRRLTAQGVLIDFQDQNRNKKTALHLAVEKCDVICVMFLLQLKPNLEVEDEDGKTSIDLARLTGYDDILNVLINSSVDVVNESYIEVIDYESLTRQKIEAIKSRPTFKALKLINCPSSNEVWVKLYDHDYVKRFNESSHLFFIAIETNEANIDNNHELMKKVLNLRKPMIVQLSSPNSRNTKIYFKDDSKDFVEITDSQQMTREEFDKAVESKVDCNMKLLVAALRSNIFGHFTSDLLGTKLKNNEDRNEAVNQFARSNALCHRFFKLFDEGQPQIDTIVAALSFKGNQSLLALLDLPFHLNDEKLKLTDNQQNIMRVVDPNGCNLLILAAEQKNLDAVKLLLRCGCDFNHADSRYNRASDICWEVKIFDSLAVLIEAGSPYPNNFCNSKLEESSDAFKRINEMTKAVDSFHVNIEQGEAEEVKKFITIHPHIKHAYNTINNCALTVALQCDKFEMYSLLMSKGFEPGADDDEYPSACLRSNFKDEIRDSNRKYFRKAFNEPHLMRLLSKYRLSLGSKDRAKCSTIIQKMFVKLNEIDEIIPILKICSTSDKLKIVFDFNCGSVVDMDPSRDSETSGVTYSSDGFVYVGAKNQFYEVIGTLAHELTHYAMQLTYENNCRPYNYDDEESENHFEEITTGVEKICGKDENPSTDPIVTAVFECYSEEVRHQELIVRVPELLATYKMNPTALKAAERKTSELFHFYREKTLKDVAIQSRVLHKEFLIGKINKQTGIVKKIENMKVQFENVESVDLKSSVNVITSNSPQLTLAMLNQILESDSHIFVTLEQVAIGNVLDKIAKINSRQSSAALIVDCIGSTQKYSESLRNLPKKLKNIKTIALVMKEIEVSAVKEIFPSAESKTYTHKWAELTEDTKLNLLNKIVSFQGIEMALSELVKTSSEAMNFFPLCDILDREDFKIGHSLHTPSHNFYIDSEFTRKDQATRSKGFDELLRVKPIIGVMIISDEAGSGKSVTLFEMAKLLFKMFPDRWVLFVDLKRHIEAFKCIGDQKKIEAFQDFISELILENETEFDRELFKQMFRDGKTFILFDGFDEISPNYKNLLFHVLKLFTPELGNRIFITTRPHLEEDLEGALGDFVFKLEKFSDKSQKSFLRQYWQSVAFKSDTDFEVLSKRLLQKFSNISNSSFIGLPLLMRMTAEIFNDPVKENSLDKVESLNVASIFREFVDKYLERWKETGSEIARKENVEIDRDGGILEIHHSIAIKHKYGGKFSVLEVDEGDAEKIARVGLIRFDENKKTFQFIHETFAEYFVADFIWFHLKRKNRSPSHDCRIAIEIFIEVLSDDHNHRVIHTFLDQILETTKLSLNEISCQSLGKCLSEVVQSQNRFHILCRGMTVSGENIMMLLLSIVKCAEQDILIQMLESSNEETGPALLNAIPSPEDIVTSTSTLRFSTLCNLIATRVENPKRIFQQTNQGYANILFSATLSRTSGVFEALCESLNTVLTKDEIKSMLLEEDSDRNNIIFNTVHWGCALGLYELLSLLPNYLSVEELKRLLTATDRFEQNCLQRAIALKPDKLFLRIAERFQVKIAGFIVRFLSDFAKRTLDTENLKIFFQRQVGKSRKNIFHLTAQSLNIGIFQTLIKSTCDILSSDDFKSMLMEKDSGGSNVLHLVTKFSNEILLKELNSVLREYLTDDDIRKLLLQVNEKGENCYRLADNNVKIDFEVFREVVGNLLPQEEQTRLLQESSREINIFKLVSGINNTGEDVPIESIKYLLTKTNTKGRNAFQAELSDRNRNAERWNQLVAFAQARFSVEETKSFLLDCGLNGGNCFNLAVANSYENESLCKAVVDTFKRVFSVEEQRKIMQQRSFNQTNVLNAAMSGGLGSLKFVIEYLSALLSKDEIEAMFKPNEGQTCIQYVARSKLRNPRDAMRSLSDFAKTILSHDDQKKFFEMKNRNLFHLAAKPKAVNIKNFFRLGSKIEDLFSTIHECLKGVFTGDGIKSMIQEKDSNGNNLLNLICQFKSPLHFIIEANPDPSAENIVLDFFKVLKEVFDADELRDFLLSSNNHGSNCLLLAAKFKNQKFLEKIFNFLQIELSIDDLRDLIQQCDSDGNNIFICHAQNDCYESHYEMFSIVSDFAKKNLSEDQIREMLLHENKFNCFQYSVMSQSIDDIESLCATIKTILSHDDQRKMFGGNKHNPLHLAAKNSNFFMFTYIHKLLLGVLTDIEVRFMIKEKDSNGNNILHLICQNDCEKYFHPYDYSIKYILLDFSKLLRDVFDADEWKGFLRSSNDDGSNCLLLAAKCRDEDFLKHLIKFIETELSLDDLRDLFQHHDNHGNNIFKCASRKNSSFVKFFARKILSDDQYKLLDDEFTIDEDEEMEAVDDDDDESSNYISDEELSI